MKCLSRVRSKSQARFLGEGDGSNAIPLPGKARLEAWRATRKYTRQPIPGEFHQTAAEMARRYSPSLIRKVLKLDPWRLKKPSIKKPAHAHQRPQTAFFTLPPEGTLLAPSSTASHNLPGCRIQIERPDGSRLTLTLPSLDLASINRICSDFNYENDSHKIRQNSNGILAKITRGCRAGFVIR